MNKTIDPKELFAPKLDQIDGLVAELDALYTQRVEGQGANLLMLRTDMRVIRGNIEEGRDTTYSYRTLERDLARMNEVNGALGDNANIAIAIMSAKLGAFMEEPASPASVGDALSRFMEPSRSPLETGTPIMSEGVAEEVAQLFEKLRAAVAEGKKEEPDFDNLITLTDEDLALEDAKPVETQALAQSYTEVLDAADQLVDAAQRDAAGEPAYEIDLGALEDEVRAGLADIAAQQEARDYAERVAALNTFRYLNDDIYLPQEAGNVFRTLSNAAAPINAMYETLRRDKQLSRHLDSRGIADVLTLAAQAGSIEPSPVTKMVIGQYEALMRPNGEAGGFDDNARSTLDVLVGLHSAAIDALEKGATDPAIARGLDAIESFFEADERFDNILEEYKAYAVYEQNVIDALHDGLEYQHQQTNLFGEADGKKRFDRATTEKFIVDKLRRIEESEADVVYLTRALSVIGHAPEDQRGPLLGQFAASVLAFGRDGETRLYPTAAEQAAAETLIAEKSFTGYLAEHAASLTLRDMMTMGIVAEKTGIQFVPVEDIAEEAAPEARPEAEVVVDGLDDMLEAGIAEALRGYNPRPDADANTAAGAESAADEPEDFPSIAKSRYTYLPSASTMPAYDTALQEALRLALVRTPEDGYKKPLNQMKDIGVGANHLNKVDALVETLRTRGISGGVLNSLLHDELAAGSDITKYDALDTHRLRVKIGRDFEPFYNIFKDLPNVQKNLASDLDAELARGNLAQPSAIQSLDREIGFAREADTAYLQLTDAYEDFIASIATESRAHQRMESGLRIGLEAGIEKFSRQARKQNLARDIVDDLFRDLRSESESMSVMAALETGLAASKKWRRTPEEKAAVRLTRGTIEQATKRRLARNAFDIEEDRERPRDKKLKELTGEIETSHYAMREKTFAGLAKLGVPMLEERAWLDLQAEQAKAEARTAPQPVALPAQESLPAGSFDFDNMPKILRDMGAERARKIAGEEPVAVAAIPAVIAPVEIEEIAEAQPAAAAVSDTGVGLLARFLPRRRKAVATPAAEPAVEIPAVEQAAEAPVVDDGKPRIPSFLIRPDAKPGVRVEKTPEEREAIMASMRAAMARTTGTGIAAAELGGVELPSFLRRAQDMQARADETAPQNTLDAGAAHIESLLDQKLGAPVSEEALNNPASFLPGMTRAANFDGPSVGFTADERFDAPLAGEKEAPAAKQPFVPLADRLRKNLSERRAKRILASAARAKTRMEAADLAAAEAPLEAAVEAVAEQPAKASRMAGIIRDMQNARGKVEGLITQRRKKKADDAMFRRMEADLQKLMAETTAGDIPGTTPEQPAKGQRINYAAVQMVGAKAKGMGKSFASGTAQTAGWAAHFISAVGTRWPSIAVGVGYGVYIAAPLKAAIAASVAGTSVAAVAPVVSFAAPVLLAGAAGALVFGQVSHRFTELLPQSYRESRYYTKDDGVTYRRARNVGKFLGHRVTEAGVYAQAVGATAWNVLPKLIVSAGAAAMTDWNQFRQGGYVRDALRDNTAVVAVKSLAKTGSLLSHGYKAMQMQNAEFAAANEGKKMGFFARSKAVLSAMTERDAESTRVMLSTYGAMFGAAAGLAYTSDPVQSAVHTAAETLRPVTAPIADAVSGAVDETAKALAVLLERLRGQTPGNISTAGMGGDVPTVAAPPETAEDWIKRYNDARLKPLDVLRFGPNGTVEFIQPNTLGGLPLDQNGLLPDWMRQGTGSYFDPTTGQLRTYDAANPPVVKLNEVPVIVTPADPVADAIAQATTNTGKVIAFTQDASFVHAQEYIAGLRLTAGQRQVFDQLIARAQRGSFTALNDLTANISEGGIVRGNNLTDIRTMAPNHELALEIRTAIAARLKESDFSQAGFRTALARNADHLNALQGNPSRVAESVETRARARSELVAEHRRVAAEATPERVVAKPMNILPENTVMAASNPLTAIRDGATRLTDRIGSGIRNVFSPAADSAAEATATAAIPHNTLGTRFEQSFGKVVTRGGFPAKELHSIAVAANNGDATAMSKLQAWARHYATQGKLTTGQAKLVEDLGVRVTRQPALRS